MVVKQEHQGQMFMFPMDINDSEYAPRDTKLWREFLQFHNAHPEIYEIFKQLISQVARKGYQKFGSQSLIEKIRWEVILGDGDKDAEFKINNNHGPYYARLYMMENPGMKGFFKTRRLKS